MNTKQVKKLRQLYKRDLKKQVMKEYSLFRSALKPKPRFMPVWVWKRLVLIYVRKNYTDKLFGKKML